MKRILAVLLCLATLLSFAACGKKSDAPAKETTIPQPQNNTAAGTPGSGTTLMIYMVGSDLEAKGGAGTNDMEEILDSQVDLSCNNVLLYAGGTKKWHNDELEDSDGHTLLQLTAEGFQSLETREEDSMGNAETLSYFLNYAHSNYRSDNYALILWDHGNGPLIGYGKDMLHDNDSLTLSEMRQALENSPFTGENKLSWVGFDACLMSSVELACIWQDHADYLIVSQEVEPAFGWNYDFLQNLGKTDTETLAEQIAQQYLDSCLKYYERRNFDQRDTTLSCLKLSQLDPLNEAMEALFTKARDNVAEQYSALVAARTSTRALGRASTGSEYDLIDLVDLAERMKEHYPEEAEAVVKAARELVLHNVTNAEGCSGLSIYYPFYNKSYYEKTWSDVYRELDVLPAYTAYLDAYAERWLEKDLLQNVAASVQPTARTDSEFVLELTDRQAENFADASYYILQREGDQIYTRIYTSSNVVKKKNQLIASFDGNILYAKNKFDNYWIPCVDEHDTVGDYTRFSTYVNLTNDLPIYSYKPEGYKQVVAGHRFHISVNNVTKEIKTSALVPYNASVDTESLVGGKQEDADLSAWSQYYFLHERHVYLERDENGVILPLKQWQASSYLSGNVSRVGDGIEFVLAPIPAGEYYLMYEIEDTQGNRYCSELLPIYSEGASLPGNFRETPAKVTWESGDRVKLFSQEGVTVYLTATEEKYDATPFALQVENTNDFDVAIFGYELMYNNTISCPDASFGYFVVPAGETVTERGISYGDAQDLGMVADLRSLQFEISVVTAVGDRTLVYHKPVSITLSEYASGLQKFPPEDSLFSDTKYFKTDFPAYGLQAEKQVLFEKDGLRATLLGLGSYEDSDRINLNFLLENTGSESRTFAILGAELDGVFVNQASGPITVEPGTAIYRSYFLTADVMELCQITSAASFKLKVSHMAFATLQGGGGFSELQTYHIHLAKSGKKASLTQGSTLVYKDEAVEIYLKSAGEEQYGGYRWTFTMKNLSDRDLMLSCGAVGLNGKTVNMDSLSCPLLMPYDDRCPAGQVTAFDAKYIGSETGSLELTFTPQFYDMAGENLLWEGTTVTLNKN